MTRCQINLLEADNIPLNTERLHTIIDDACKQDELENVQLNVLIVNDEESARLHGDHFNDPTTTDVMTFPDGSPDPESERTHLGDLAVCIDVATREAEKRSATVDDELTLYIVHGFLHILGYDDQTPEDRAEMWQAQYELLLRHGITIEAQPD